MADNAESAPTQSERDHALMLLRQMMLIRRFEEKCAEAVQRPAKSAASSIFTSAKKRSRSARCRRWSPTTRSWRPTANTAMRWCAASRPTAVMAEMYGKQEGCSRGRGGSMHLFDAATRFYGGNAIVGGGLPIAVGLALADKMAERPRVTACFFGEGAVAEGEFHESLNLAALWKLPVLFCCENNLYAMGTALGRSESETDLSSKGVEL